MLLRKERSYAEVYNDLDGEIVNLFRAMSGTVRVSLLKNLMSLSVTLPDPVCTWIS